MLNRPVGLINYEGYLTFFFKKKNTPRVYSGGVVGCALSVSCQLRLRSPRILFVERLSQALEVGIEGDEAGGALKEGLATRVIAQSIE